MVKRLVFFLMLVITSSFAFSPQEKTPSNPEGEVVVNITFNQASTSKKTSSLTWKEWFSSIKKSFSNQQWIEEPIIYAAAGLAFTFLSNPQNMISGCSDFFSEHKLPLKMCKTLIQQYVRYFLINLAHEGGHALTNYAFSNKVADIYLGTDTAHDGVEITSHIILSGVHPSKGSSQQLNNPLALNTEELLKIHHQLEAAHPEKKFSEIKKLPDFEQAKLTARTQKDTLSKLKFIALMASGPIAGLIMNGLFKITAGESILSIDYYDIAQLLNFFPRTGSDGGQIIDIVTGRQAISQWGYEWFDSIRFLTFFFKEIMATGLSRVNSESEIISNIMRALGLSCFNRATVGVFHTTGPAPAA